MTLLYLLTLRTVLKNQYLPRYIIDTTAQRFLRRQSMINKVRETIATAGGTPTGNLVQGNLVLNDRVKSGVNDRRI